MSGRVVTEDIFETAVKWIQANQRIPVSTYRLQFNRSFTFKDARKLISYLHDLGITDCYASPYLKARPDSTHGYDICDHNSLNPAIGSEQEYDAFVADLHKRDMGQILDMVPNHMGVGDLSNTRWYDILENGPSSPYAGFFDIDWKPLGAGVTLEDKVLLPILGEPYGRVLESQQLKLVYQDGGFFVYYWDNKLPIEPQSQVDVLRFGLDDLSKTLAPDDEHLLELQSIITALTHLPPANETNPDKIAERQREKEVARRRLLSLCQSCEAVRLALDETVRTYNGVVGDAHSFDLLDALLDKQAYRLAYWRVAAEEINYRRFFDINDLAAIRVEKPEVFCDTHRLVLDLLADGKVNGLRVDHPDGLWDPRAYLRRLQASYFAEVCSRLRSTVQQQPSDEAHPSLEALQRRYEREVARHHGSILARPLYTVVEKILSGDESLREDWPVHGTTGYDFANWVNGIFVQRASRKAFDDIYSGFIGARVDFRKLVNSSKKMIMLVSLAAEVNMLAFHLKRMASKNRSYRDFTLNLLTYAIREVIAALPVYRTYVGDENANVDRRDRAAIVAAVAEAKRLNPRTAPAVFDFIEDILLLRSHEDVTDQEKMERLYFVMKFQQTTGPVMAKGVEDTAFYVYNRLVSLNEVGGDPEQFGVTAAAFHAQNLDRLRKWPHSMVSTSTHDSKRSEDVRARINVLSEMPREWKAALARWSKMNHRKKRTVDGKEAPDRNEECLIYQTLLGAWPLNAPDPERWQAFVERIQAYILKAIKEAKVNTSWVNPATAYDEAVQSFVGDILDRSKINRFIEDFEVLQRKISHFGMYNSLSQTLLKLTVPGMPDIYQGNEIWDFSLVDPDNRRPVDYARRARMLRALQRRISTADDDLDRFAAGLVRTKEDGRIKLYVTHRTLVYRRDNKDLFAVGSYIPLDVGGGKKEHAFAFARVEGQRSLLVIVPRLVCTLIGEGLGDPLGFAVWEGTWVTVPPEMGKSFRNIFTGETIDAVKQDSNQVLMLGSVFSAFPVALLETAPEG